ncbi:MAG: RnfABCDGE type electron transport complex subunit D [Candidatus Omnitrophica bacterium]|nr:RnfABCDGE type electron transport complex subunit D [Candidatus Omnitrophota bacterium]
MLKNISLKTQLILFLSFFAIYLAIQQNDFLFLLTLFIAVISCVGLELIFSYFKNKKFSFSESAVISGLIIAFVVDSEEPLWVFILIPFLAIISKYLFRIKGRHVFNPAAFGIFLASVAFGVTTQWRGTYLWYILAPFGIYFIYKIRKLEIIISYGITALLLFGFSALRQNIPLVHIFGYLSYFFIFIMLIEPKTTPVKFKGKVIFGSAVALLIFILTSTGVRFDAELCALLVLNITVPLLNKIP